MSLTAIIDRAASVNRWRHRPVVEKACLALGSLLLALLLPPWPGAGLVAISLLLITFFGARVPPALWLAAALPPMGFLLTGALTLVVQIAPDGIGWSDTGLWEAGHLVLRSCAALICLLFLAFTTPMTDLLVGLRRLGVPVELVEIALLTYRFVFLLGDAALAMTQAQRARLGHATPRRQLRSVAMVIANLLPRALDQARRLEIGLAARGWTGEMRVLGTAQSPSPWRLAAILALLAGLALAGVGLA